MEMKEKLSKDQPASVRTGNTGTAAAADSRKQTIESCRPKVGLSSH